MFDLTLMLDRLRCTLFGHPGPPPTSLLHLHPWERPRCWRCGTRLQRPHQGPGGATLHR